MAIAVDATSSKQETSITTSTLAHTCTGSDLVLAVTVFSDTAISGVTYKGAAMVLGASASAFGSTAQVYYLVAPSTGANNIVVTIASSGNVTFGGVSFTGAKGIGNNATETDETGSNLTITTPITTAENNSYVVAMEEVNDNSATPHVMTQDTGQTEIFDQWSTAAWQSAGIYQQIVTAATTDFTFTADVVGVIRHALLEIQEGTQPVGGTGNFFQLF